MVTFMQISGSVRFYATDYCTANYAATNLQIVAMSVSVVPYIVDEHIVAVTS